ncbi:MAG: DUF4157 domain-containing protein [Chloroflexota bacterium]|nr:DUF4157 domain-containing protein [Chloroflexota bacterium]
MDDLFVTLLSEALPNLRFDRVRVRTSGIPIRILRRLNGAGMAMGHHIYVLPEYYDMGSFHGLSIIAHELKHVEQHERQGMLRHSIIYFMDLIKNRFKYSESLPLEREAYNFERELMYRYSRMKVQH